MFEVFPDFVVVEDAEAVYDRGGGACRFHDVFGVKVEVFTVSHCEDNGVGSHEGGRQVFRYPDVLEGKGDATLLLSFSVLTQRRKAANINNSV